MRTFLVTGDRHWNDPGRIESVLDGLLRIHGPFILIEGGAPGADHCAAVWARKHPEITHKSYPAQWSRYGNGAGPIRNALMIRDNRNIDTVLVFHNDLEHSRGTKDMVNKARRANLSVSFYGSN